MSLSRKWFLALVAVALSTIGFTVEASEVVDSSVSAMLAEQSERIRQLETQLASLHEQQSFGGETYVEPCDSCCRGLIGGAEVTYLKAHSNALSYSDSNGNAFVILPGFDFEAAPRFWLGYEFGGGVGVRATYWGYDQSVVHPDVPLITSLEATSLDLELTQQMSICSWEIQASAGARYARTDSETGIDFFGPISLSREFEGTGGTLGMRVRRPFGSRGFAVIAGVRGSLIYGSTDATLDLNGLLGVDNATITKNQTMLEIYELRMGGEWSRDLANGSRVYAQLAYEAQAWNLSPTIPIVETPITGFTGVSLALGFAR